MPKKVCLAGPCGKKGGMWGYVGGAKEEDLAFFFTLYLSIMNNMRGCYLLKKYQRSDLISGVLGQLVFTFFSLLKIKVIKKQCSCYTSKIFQIALSLNILSLWSHTPCKYPRNSDSMLEPKFPDLPGYSAESQIRSQFPVSN